MKKIISLLLVSLLAVGFSLSSASAYVDYMNEFNPNAPNISTETLNGVEISAHTLKEIYSPSETIILCYRIKNTNDFSIATSAVGGAWHTHAYYHEKDNYNTKPHYEELNRSAVTSSVELMGGEEFYYYTVFSTPEDPVTEDYTYSIHFPFSVKSSTGSNATLDDFSLITVSGDFKITLPTPTEPVPTQQTPVEPAPTEPTTEQDWVHPTQKVENPTYGTQTVPNPSTGVGNVIIPISVATLLAGAVTFALIRKKRK